MAKGLTSTGDGDVSDSASQIGLELERSAAGGLPAPQLSRGLPATVDRKRQRQSRPLLDSQLSLFAACCASSQAAASEPKVTELIPASVVRPVPLHGSGRQT